MNINATLFIQCFNFWITYRFLRWAFLRPVVDLILKKEEQKEKLSYEIAKQESFIAKVYGDRQAGWQEFRQHCYFNRPITMQDIFIQNIVDVQEISDYVMPEKQFKVLVNSLSEKIVDSLKPKVDV